MAWAVRKYTNSQYDKAGAKLAMPRLTLEAMAEAYPVVHNWRVAHHYPLNTMQLLLRDRARRVDNTSTTSQRLKRYESIAFKLLRSQTTRLTQIQDIGGCRAVLASVKRVQHLDHIYATRPTGHRIISRDDYIGKPQPTGYRGIHLVCRHFSKKHPEHDRLLIEVQLRSRLQHIWATTVETVDSLAGDFLKFGLGTKKWQRYFALASSLFAMKEGTALVPGTPMETTALLSEIRRLTRELNVEMRLRTYSEAVQIAQMSHEMGEVEGKHFLLEVTRAADPRGHMLKITGFSARHRAEAEAALQLKEQAIASENATDKDVVLVAVDSIASLQAAYPNYYMDTGAFLSEMGSALHDPSPLVR